jgi:hypothetical protein
MTQLELFKLAYSDAETQAALEQCFNLGVQQERERVLAEMRSGLTTAELDSMIVRMSAARSGEQVPEIVIRKRSQ